MSWYYWNRRDGENTAHLIDNCILNGRMSVEVTLCGVEFEPSPSDCLMFNVEHQKCCDDCIAKFEDRRG